MRQAPEPSPSARTYACSSSNLPSSLMFLPCPKQGSTSGRLCSEGSTTSTTLAPYRREAQVGRPGAPFQAGRALVLARPTCSTASGMNPPAVGARRPFGGITPRRAAARRERTQRGLLRGARTFAHKKRRQINAIPTVNMPRTSDIIDDWPTSIIFFWRTAPCASCASRSGAPGLGLAATV